MKYTLGLDIGIASVGWSVINNDKERIERLGVRIFDRAENPKDGSSLALPRRIKRGTRRRLRRRRWRIAEIKNLFVKYGFTTEEDLIKLFDNPTFEKTPWELRYLALDNKITDEELMRVLLQLAKRRGYKSNRKSDLDDSSKEDGKINGSILKNIQLLESNHYRTVGEMFWKDEKFSLAKRNHDGSYELSVNRGLLYDEAMTILNKQKELGNEKITKEFINEYLMIWGTQKPFASKEQILKLIGQCTLEPDEKRGAKAGYTAERFMLLQKVNNLRLVGNKERIDGKLTQEEREKLIELAYENSQVTYKQIRKKLELQDNEKFKDVRYKKDEDSEKIKFIELGFRNKVRSAIKEISEDRWNELQNNVEVLDYIGTALTLFKTDDDITNYLKDKNVDEDVINAVLKLSFNGVMHLSIKAMRNINPYLEKGLVYNEACQEAGYDFKGTIGGNKEKFLPVIDAEEIKNPVVMRALTQTRKVINAVINEYGSPYEIHIEFARDVAKNFKERQDIKKNQENNKDINEKIAGRIKELFPSVFANTEPKATDILKYKLYNEQDGKCLYSLKPLDISRLFEDGYVQIDHAIPYSRSYNDSYMNKVLVLSEENQHKGNRLPYEYMNGDNDRWTKYCNYVWSLNIPLRKKEILTKEKYTREDANEWKDRNINDTRYIAVFMKNYIENNLLFDDCGDKENRKKVITLNGAITSYLRNVWGLKKVRSESDTHHALDATVIAVCTNKNIKNVSDFIKYNKEIIYDDSKRYIQNEETGEIEELSEIKAFNDKHAPQPWNGFRDELSIRMMSFSGNNLLVDSDMQKLLEDYIVKYERQDSFDDVEINKFKSLFVSKAPKRKVKGAAHLETIYSKNVFNADGLENISDVCVKKPIRDIKLSDLENMVGKETDMLTYNLLHDRLVQFGDKPQKAFEEPLYKTKKDGTNGPQIKSIKIKSKINHGVNINNGVAANNSMVRTDVFEKDGKLYLVPIYIADTKAKELPNRAITALKPYEEWTIIDKTYNFKFSLFKNDIIRIKKNKPINITITVDKTKDKVDETYAYFDGTDSATGGIAFNSIDNSFSSIEVGVKTGISILEKYTVDTLGNYHKVEKETRVGFSNNSNK